MAVYADRVKETTTTTGTGTINLDGAPTGYRTFIAGAGNGATVSYCIAHQSNGEWEVGSGTVTDGTPDTLSRGAVQSSSNAGAAVNFSAGTKDVFLVITASDFSSAARGATAARVMFSAAALDSVGTNGASLLNLGNATTARLCRGFDDTTETYTYGLFQVPDSINTAGTVLFNAIGGLRSSTTGNVLWTFGERESATGEAWTGAYAEYDSAATAFSGATTTQFSVGWSTSASALGWQSGDIVRFRLSRDPAASGDATGDALLDYFYIDIPTS